MRLEEAEAQRQDVQERLDQVLAHLDEVEAEKAEVEDRVDALQAEAKSYQQAAGQAEGLLQARVREAYKQGHMPFALSLLSSDPNGPEAERARLLSVLAARDRADSEFASAARLRAASAADAVAQGMTELRAQQAELDQARADVQAALADAQAHFTDGEQEIAAEIAERAARQRVARQRSATSSTTAAPATTDDAPAEDSGDSGGGSSAGAAVSGGTACPVGTPRSYSDTYGAPRSGGRSHQGVDILAPMGTPIYAYESGTITRMDGNALGGISLYLQGDSGSVYYYTHMSGYASSASVGKHVSAGEHIAYVGDSGNAAGIPHLHWEVMPGGGGSVNPYPYAFRACG